MAAESGDSGPGVGEGEDGEGSWGLELVLSLKMVRLGGRGVGNKEEFGEMILRAREGIAAGQRESPIVVPSIPHHPAPTHPRAAPSHAHPRRIEPRLIPPGEGSSPGSSNPGFRPARTSTSATTSLPHLSDGSTPRAPGFQRPPLQPTRDSLPPSSLPMSSSSSAHGPPLPPSRHSSASVVPNGANQRSSSIPPPLHSSSSGPIPPSSATANTTSETTPTLSKAVLPKPGESSESDPAQNPREREREVTPPPLPRPRSPPPSTPARLQAILRADAKLSPGLARSLASNPTLLRLLKSVPASAVPVSTLNALKSPLGGTLGVAAGSGGGTKGGGGGSMVHDPNNPFAPSMPPPAFLDSPSKSKSLQRPKPSPAKSTGSAASDFPTPASSATTVNPDQPAQVTRTNSNLTTNAATGASSRSGSAHPPSDNVTAPESKCDNCHATQSTTWRTRKAKDGRVTMKVCDECGLYFNQHKKMRPKEVWEAARSQANGENIGASAGAGKRKIDPPQGVRSSPRRSVSMGHHRSTSQSNARSNTNTAATGVTATNTAALPDAHTSTAQDSPRKRRKTGPPPTPSPRRNTRAAAKELQNSAGPGGESMGIGPNAQLRALQDDSRVSPSPDTKRTRTAIGVSGGNGHGHGKKKEDIGLGSSPNSFGIASSFSSSAQPGSSGLAANPGTETVNLEAILRQFTNGGNPISVHQAGGVPAGLGTGPAGEGGEEVVDIDKWFAEVGIDLGALEADGWGGGDWAGGT